MKNLKKIANEILAAIKTIELAVVATDRRKAEKILKDEGYTYDIGNSVKHPGADLFEIQLDNFSDYKHIVSNFSDSHIRFWLED